MWLFLLALMLVIYFLMPFVFVDKNQLKQVSSFHVSSLDSLRGLAALSVCGGHYLQHLKLAIYFPTHQAVILFFVLSGYVLSLSLQKNQYTYKEFIIRRYFRIYPAYYIAIILSTVGILGIAAINIKYVLNWLFLFTDIGNIFHDIIFSDWPLIGHPIDQVTWSLTYEIIISCLLPFLLRFFLDFKNAIVINITMIGYIFCSVLAFYFLRLGICSIFYYSAFFIVGFLLLFNVKSAKHYSGMLYILFGVVGVMNNSVFIYFNYQVTGIFTIDMLSAIGSILLINGCIHNRHLIKIMSFKIFIFYGNVSYSFYLLHGPILWIAMRYFGEYNLILVLSSSFVVSSVLSLFIYNFVERPFISMGGYTVRLLKLRHETKLA
jgi:peptidoglycan/LPS O-acetylase OafA/YrhL